MMIKAFSLITTAPVCSCERVQWKWVSVNFKIPCNCISSRTCIRSTQNPLFTPTNIKRNLYWQNEKYLKYLPTNHRRWKAIYVVIGVSDRFPAALLNPKFNAKFTLQCYCEPTQNLESKSFYSDLRSFVLITLNGSYVNHLEQSAILMN